MTTAGIGFNQTHVNELKKFQIVQTTIFRRKSFKLGQWIIRSIASIIHCQGQNAMIYNLLKLLDYIITLMDDSNAIKLKSE